MSLWKAYWAWKKRKANSDFDKIKVSSSGSFHMSTADIFNDKDEVKEYVRLLNESLESHNKAVQK